MAKKTISVCAPKIWKKLNPAQRRIWQAVFDAMKDPHCSAGPGMVKMLQDPRMKEEMQIEWDTLHHNAACYAAWAAAE